MQTLYTFVSPPSSCGYLPEETWELEYEIVQTMTAAEYMERMEQGWRRFGRAIFRPRCQACQKCQPIRVVVDRFHPDRSQRRAARDNEGMVEIHIRKPTVSPSRLQLYDRFHAFQSDNKGWPSHPAKEVDSFAGSFVDNPFPAEEWCYVLDGQLIGLGYVDVLPAGLSAIYFVYEPEQRHRSLGTWNVQKIIEAAAFRGLPHVYLGYFVDGCASMAYKASFQPNEVRRPDGVWVPFRSRE